MLCHTWHSVPGGGGPRDWWPFFVLAQKPKSEDPPLGLERVLEVKGRSLMATHICCSPLQKLKGCGNDVAALCCLPCMAFCARRSSWFAVVLAQMPILFAHLLLELNISFAGMSSVMLIVVQVPVRSSLYFIGLFLAVFLLFTLLLLLRDVGQLTIYDPQPHAYVRFFP